MSTAETIAHPTTQRAPKGCNRPVMTHVTQDERDRLDALATEQQRSLSATTRLLVLKGLAQLDAEAGAAGRA
ncbi:MULTISPECIES: hypothetical protein [Halomonas]|uniref:Ribbon-helix-helix protein CopG domain-containing protein n=2 Tax=Halomonas TaxID=2745 RepID=A0ABQ0U7R6_9GAMM|nr:MULTISPECIES: hypothetical protein [Halomonas]MDR5891126.1 hypothetical protein [Halomonas salina]WJY08410.1 hypothetical protein QWG60_05715 [Halomonas halophila]GEK74211.1 hypothetical protein HHA04nite_27550 [Halomonas halophila]